MGWDWELNNQSIQNNISKLRSTVRELYFVKNVIKLIMWQLMRLAVSMLSKPSKVFISTINDTVDRV